MKKLLFSLVLLLVGISTQLVGASSSVDFEDEKIIVEASDDPLTDWGRELLSGDDDFVANTLYSTMNVLYWYSSDDPMVIYIRVEGENNGYRVGIMDDENTVIYSKSFTSFESSYGTGITFLRCTLKEEMTASVGILDPSIDVFGNLFSNNPPIDNVTFEQVSLITRLFKGLNSIVVGFIALLIVLFADTGIIAIFYSDELGMTLLGVLLLIPIGFVLTKWAFGYVRKLLSMRG